MQRARRGWRGAQEGAHDARHGLDEGDLAPERRVDVRELQADVPPGRGRVRFTKAPSEMFLLPAANAQGSGLDVPDPLDKNRR